MFFPPQYIITIDRVCICIIYRVIITFFPLINNFKHFPNRFSSLLAEIYTQPSYYAHRVENSNTTNPVGFVRLGVAAAVATTSPPSQDKSVLFDILCKERQQEDGAPTHAPSDPATLVESKDPFYDLRHTLTQLNMSLPRRNGLKSNIDSATSNATNHGPDTSKTKTATRRKQPVDEKPGSLCSGGLSSSSATATTDDERTTRLRARNVAKLPSMSNKNSTLNDCPSGSGQEEKRSSINTKSRSVPTAAAVSSGDDSASRSNRSQRASSNTSSTLRNDNIRTTKTSRLRAAALGKYLIIQY